MKTLLLMSLLVTSINASAEVLESVASYVGGVNEKADAMLKIKVKERADEACLIKHKSSHYYAEELRAGLTFDTFEDQFFPRTVRVVRFRYKCNLGW